MNITLSTDGNSHYVCGYGKQNLNIISAPLSILKKIVAADCLEVLQPLQKEDFSLIRLKDEYVRFATLKNSGVAVCSRGYIYNLTLCTRKNELLQYYSEQWNKKLITLADFLYALNEQHEGYCFGINYGPSGIQMFVEDALLLVLGENLTGKKLFYPFLVKELEEEIEQLKRRVNILLNE